MLGWRGWSAASEGSPVPWPMRLREASSALRFQSELQLYYNYVVVLRLSTTLNITWCAHDTTFSPLFDVADEEAVRFGFSESLICVIFLLPFC